MAAFKKHENDPANAILARYAYNIALCESLYPVLHFLEISLRNAICRAMASRDCADGKLMSDGRVNCWLDRPETTSILTPNHRKKVSDAKREIGKDMREVSEGRLVAQLGFGFWTSLFTSPYGDRSPRQLRMWPSLFPTAFPNLDAGMTRALLEERLTRIRHLRNRAFHHEPIWTRRLKRDEEDILQVIYWMGYAPAEFAASVSRVQAVERAALEPFQSKITALAISAAKRAAL